MILLHCDRRIRRQQAVRRDDDAAPTRRNGSDADSESVDDVIEGCCSDWQEDVHPHCVAPRSAPPPFIIHRRKGADDGEPVDRVCSHTISGSSSSSSSGGGGGLTRVPDNRLQTGVSLTLAGDKSTTLYGRITGDVTCTPTSLTWLTGVACHVTDRPTHSLSPWTSDEITTGKHYYYQPFRNGSTCVDLVDDCKKATSIHFLCRNKVKKTELLLIMLNCSHYKLYA